MVTDVEVAGLAARAAAEELLPLLRSGRLRDRALGDAGDAAAQRAIAAVLAEHRPGDAVFSEEAVDDPVRLTADRVWIVDPLDGTREYRAGDRQDWAVHVALWSRGASRTRDGGAEGHLTAAAVGLPALGEVHCTDPAPVLPPLAAGPLRVAVSRSRPPAQARAAADALGAVLVPLGSAGYKTSGRRPRAGRRLRARGRDVPVGLGGAGRRRPRGRTVGLPAGRLRTRLQRARCLAA